MEKKLAIFYPEGHQAHYEPGHPESPARIEAVKHSLEEVGWWELLPKIRPNEVSRDLLEKVHSSTYLDLLPRLCRFSEYLDQDTYTCPESWDLALKSAGGAIAIAREVWRGSLGFGQTENITNKPLRGFALTRPPGHHATRKVGMGFCLLNNIALAAEALIAQPEQGESAASRVAIIDLDLHHGNGTQDIFWQRGDVFYISTHQSPLYPGTGSLLEIGAGEGEGATANFPLPPGTGDKGFYTVMTDLILPLLQIFRPEILLISIGFDPHWADPLGHLQLSATGYAKILDCLVRFAEETCNGRIALFLEGGYHIGAISSCSQALVGTLLGIPWHDQMGLSPRPEGKSWQSLIPKGREFWRI